MRATLPYTRKHYDQWLDRFGLDAEKHPPGDIILPAGRTYQPTRRYVLCTAVLPGRLLRNNLLFDAKWRTVICESGGLFQFVVIRALEFAIAQGMDGHVAFHKFVVPGQNAPSDKRICAPWAIGYDTVTGHCTILVTEQEDSARLYLEGKGGYYIPWPET